MLNFPTLTASASFFNLKPLQEGRDVGGVRNEDRHGDGSGAVLGDSFLEFELREDPCRDDLGHEPVHECDAQDRRREERQGDAEQPGADRGLC